jgi:small GTP-binding protein
MSFLSIHVQVQSQGISNTDSLSTRFVPSVGEPNYNTVLLLMHSSTGVGLLAYTPYSYSAPIYKARGRVLSNRLKLRCPRPPALIRVTMMSSPFAFVNHSNRTRGPAAVHGFETSIKLIILGEANTGKTSLSLRFTNDEFHPYTESTIGASFFEPTRTFTNAETGKTIQVTFKIWDTAGQEKYHSLASMYYRGAQSALIVFDVSRASSFLTLKRWVEELKVKGPPDIFLVVCGNKIDLEASGDRKVSKSEASEFATSIGAWYIETSARDGTNVKELFEHVAQEIAPCIPGKTNDIATIKLGESQGNRGCCRLA